MKNLTNKVKQVRKQAISKLYYGGVKRACCKIMQQTLILRKYLHPADVGALIEPQRAVNNRPYNSTLTIVGASIARPQLSGSLWK